MPSAFTRAHHGGAGPPLVCLHGFTDTWRTWQLVLPALERRHEVLAPTLAGHAGGPPLPDRLTPGALADAVERAMDAAGMGAAHLVGNSLGGYVALQLATRGRALSVVALAPAGGWAPAGVAVGPLLDHFVAARDALKAAAPHAAALTATPEGRRRATELIAVHGEAIPSSLVAHMMLGAAACPGLEAMVGHARRAGFPLDPAAVVCPLRIVWGAADRLLPWPAAAVRYREAWFPQADWVVMDDVGHCPQLDAPAATAALVVGHTGA